MEIQRWKVDIKFWEMLHPAIWRSMVRKKPDEDQRWGIIDEEILVRKGDFEEKIDD